MKYGESFQLSRSLSAIRRRWPLVFVVVLLTTGAALAFSLTAPKQYDARAELLLRDDEPINALLEPGVSMPSTDRARDLNTAIELIEAGGTAHAARRILGSERSADALLEQIEAEAASSSDIVSIRARDSEPRRAADIANAFAQAYVDFRVRSARERFQQAAALAERQLETLDAADQVSPQGQALAARQRELEIAAALQTGGAQIVRRASVPQDAARPRPVLSGTLGLLLGALLGIGAVLALELLDRRLKSEEAVEDFFALPILASIPRPARRRGSPAVTDFGQREAFGLLAAHLRFSTADEESRVIMVTSAAPGEGKTSVTLGLAQAFARLGLRVIAIEADLRRPTFRERLAFGPSRGLTGVLDDRGKLPDELVWLNPDSLRPATNGGSGGVALLPAGDLPANPQRMLAQPSMEWMLELARSLADVIVIDTAPIGTVNDPATLAPHVDALAVVVRLGATTKDAGRRAKRVLRGIDVHVPGIVLTDAGTSHEYGYYAPAPSRSSASEPVEARRT